MMLRAIVLLITATFAASIMAEEVYRWTDEQGTIHFTDRKPKQQSTRITTKRSPVAVTPQAVKNDEEVKVERCAEYRERLASFETAQSLSTKGEDGSERLLTNAERTQLIADARRQVEEFCQQ